MELNNKAYKLKIYLRFQQIFFELEADKKYSNSFGLNDLRSIDGYFKRTENLNDALEDINDLIDNEELSISEGNNSALLIIKRRNTTIEFSLIEQKDSEAKNIYDSLSNKMKEIINSNQLILGIDFGTTYSCASVMLDDKIIVIENSLGKRQIPSYVLFLEMKNNINNNNNIKSDINNENSDYNIINDDNIINNNINNDNCINIINIDNNINNDNNINFINIDNNINNDNNNKKNVYV